MTHEWKISVTVDDKLLASALMNVDIPDVTPEIERELIEILCLALREENNGVD